jgi:hypothetical protein
MNFFDRLSDYDVFAYLPQGFLVLAAIDYLVGTNFVLNANWDVTKGLLVVFVAYIAGHIAASPSSAILERWLVAKYLKPPSINLLSLKKYKLATRLFFSDYYTPLKDPLRSDVLKKLNLTTVGGIDGERIFWTTYPVATKDEYARTRMATFLNLYGFCRNVSFIAGTVALLLLVQTIWMKVVDGYYIDIERIEVAIALVIVAFAMFQRYLKFFRLYSVEVFKAFAQLTPIPLDRPGSP